MWRIGQVGKWASGQLGATMRATFIKSLSGFTGDVELYRVEPSANYPVINPDSGEWDDEGGHTEYVAVSAINCECGGPSTYIFPADEHGKILRWGGLAGSYRGGLDHAEALRRAGYTVQE